MKHLGMRQPRPGQQRICGTEISQLPEGRFTIRNCPVFAVLPGNNMPDDGSSALNSRTTNTFTSDGHGSRKHAATGLPNPRSMP
jgi:hypothetical protein